MRGVYYNDNDPNACTWLRALIAAGLLPEGDIDDRSISDVDAADLRGYRQCHFFAGIGGWPYALRLAGAEGVDGIWTGSPPCQFASSAARGRNSAADMWPAYAVLVAAIRPRFVFGEQVASRPSWADRVADDLEGLGYAFGAAVLPAFCVGADHARERLFFAGYADSYGEPSRAVHAETPWLPRADLRRGRDAGTHGLSPTVVKRGFGNAIVPQVAAEFISAFFEAIEQNAGGPSAARRGPVGGKAGPREIPGGLACQSRLLPVTGQLPGRASPRAAGGF